MIAYLETSAAAKLVVNEQESEGLALRLDHLATGGHRLVTSLLLETELRRMALREGIAQTAVTHLLDALEVLDLRRSTFREAGLLPGSHLRSVDALHVAAALELDADVMISYDGRQAAAAEAAGLRVDSPS